MKDPTSTLRSEEDTPESADDANSLPSNVSKAAPSTARGQQYPTTTATRLTYAMKGRAKDAARARGISLAAFIREAIRSALRDHADAS